LVNTASQHGARRGGGLPAKSAWLDTTNTDCRDILRQYMFYDRRPRQQSPVLENTPSRFPEQPPRNAAGAGRSWASSSRAFR
jgi:hypothetical protein